MTPTTWTAGSDLVIRILGSPTDSISVSIVDTTGDQKYGVSGDVSSDNVTYNDAAGNDQAVFSGGSNSDAFHIIDESSNDTYRYMGGMGSDVFQIFGTAGAVDPQDGDSLSISP